MARKATVNREVVLQLLREGKTSQNIASQFGVSRQAIDLHRKEFVRTGALEPRSISSITREPSPVTVQEPILTPPVTPSPEIKSKPETVSLDQMIDLIIQSLAALKKLPELESEFNKLRRQHEATLSQVVQLEEREKKRLDQEARWRDAQQLPGINQ
jgi:hypothetical protein